MTSQPATEGQRWHIYQAVTKLWYVTQEVTDTGGFGVWNEGTALQLKGVLNAALDTQAQAEGMADALREIIEAWRQGLEPKIMRHAIEKGVAALDAPRTEEKKDV